MASSRTSQMAVRQWVQQRVNPWIPSLMALKISSFNSTGLAVDKRVYINSFLNDSDTDILLVQEHWLHDSNLGELNELHEDYTGFGCSGMPVAKLLGPGRPYGGAGIIYKKNMSHKVTRIKDCKIKNVCAIALNALLLMCVYLPGDNYKKTDVLPEFRNAVDDIEHFLMSRNESSVVIGGDLNIDLRRNNAHSRYAMEFAQRCNLFFLWRPTT